MNNNEIEKIEKILDELKYACYEALDYVAAYNGFVRDTDAHNRVTKAFREAKGKLKGTQPCIHCHHEHDSWFSTNEGAVCDYCRDGFLCPERLREAFDDLCAFDGHLMRTIMLRRTVTLHII